MKSLKFGYGRPRLVLLQQIVSADTICLVQQGLFSRRIHHPDFVLILRISGVLLLFHEASELIVVHLLDLVGLESVQIFQKVYSLVQPLSFLLLLEKFDFYRITIVRAHDFVVKVCLIVGMPWCDLLRVIHIGHAVRENGLLPRSSDTFERLKCFLFISQIENS